MPWAQTVVMWNDDSPCAVRAGDSPGPVCAGRALPAGPLTALRPWQTLALQMEALHRICLLSRAPWVIVTRSPSHWSGSSQGHWMQW